MCSVDGKSASELCRSACSMECADQIHHHPVAIALYACAPVGDTLEPWKQPVIVPSPLPGMPTLPPAVPAPTSVEESEQGYTYTWGYLKGKDNTEDDDDEFSECMRTEEEIRDLKEKIFLWLSGLSEYPDELRDLFSPSLVGAPEDDPNDLIKCPERSAIQILRWVLGEVELAGE